jgi:putative flippase GtrA
MTQIVALLKKVVNKETIAYGVAGVLTTVVNFISYESIYQLGVPNLTANAFAWIIAVTFAYIVNKKNVFLSKSTSLKEEVLKIIKFFGARVITFVVEQVGMYIFTEQMVFNRLIVKAFIAVIVIILNYIFSKLFIFNKKVGS